MLILKSWELVSYEGSTGTALRNAYLDPRNVFFNVEFQDVQDILLYITMSAVAVLSIMLPVGRVSGITTAESTHRNGTKHQGTQTLH